MTRIPESGAVSATHAPRLMRGCACAAQNTGGSADDGPNAIFLDPDVERDSPVAVAAVFDLCDQSTALHRVALLQTLAGELQVIFAGRHPRFAEEVDQHFRDKPR